MKTSMIAFDCALQARKWLLVFLLGGLVSSGVFSLRLAEWGSRQAAKPALDTDLGKLLYVLQVYLHKDLKVIFNGNTYDIGKAVQKARGSLAAYYRGEEAESWVRSHLYRAGEKGRIIYLAYPDGSRRPLRDVLIEELKQLPLQS